MRAMTFPDRAMVRATGVLLALMAVAMGVGIAQRWPWVLNGLILVPAVVFVLVTARVRRDVRRRLNEAGGLICPRCGYALSSPKDFARCAECGHVTRLEEAQRFARNWTSRRPRSGVDAAVWQGVLVIGFMVAVCVMLAVLL